LRIPGDTLAIVHLSTETRHKAAWIISIRWLEGSSVSYQPVLVRLAPLIHGTIHKPKDRFEVNAFLALSAAKLNVMNVGMKDL